MLKWFLVVMLLLWVDVEGLDKRDVMEYLNETAHLSILYGLVATAQLEAILDNPAVKYTLFAPNDQAFNQMSEEAMSHILGDLGTMQRFLLGHVLDHPLISLDMANNSQATSLTGTTVHFKILGDYDFQVSGAQIAQGDLVVRNGVVHVIDQVLPLEVSAARHLQEVTQT